MKTHPHISMYVRGFILDVVDEVVPSMSRDWFEAVRWEDAPFSDPPDAFWRTLVANRGHDGKKPPRYYSHACREIFKAGLQEGTVSTTDLPNNLHSSVIAQFHSRMQAVIWNRSLIKTTSGNIGLASTTVKKGDLICILYGCSVPVILRRCQFRKTKEELSQEREEDFINNMRYFQRRWKKRIGRRWRARVQRETRPANYKDPLVLFDITLKYAHRWRRIVEANRRTRHRLPHQAESHSFGDVRSERDRPVNLIFGYPPDVYMERVVRPEWDRRFRSWLEELPYDDNDDCYFFYHFLGEAYIHSMMDGEAIRYKNAKDIRTQVFELR